MDKSKSHPSFTTQKDIDKLIELSKSRVEQRPNVGDYHRLVEKIDEQRRVEWYENRLVKIEKEIERRKAEEEKQRLAELRRVEEEKKRKQEEERKKKEEESKWTTFEATAYTAFCDTGCIGVTKTGLNVSNTTYTPKGYNVIAVDPNVINLGSIVEVKYDNKSFVARAADTGGDIKGNRIDWLVEDERIAKEFGRRNVKIKILEEG